MKLLKNQPSQPQNRWISPRIAIGTSRALLPLLIILNASGCALLHKQKMEKEFIATRVAIVKSKIDDGDIVGAQYDIVPLRQRFPDNTDILTLSGFVDITLGNHQRAIATMLRVHHLNPSASSLLNLSSAYIAAQDYRAALTVINDGIKQGQDEGYVDLGRLYHNRGYVFELQQQPDRAIQDYQQSLYHTPGYLQSLHRLTMLYHATERHREAVPYYQRYIYFCPHCFKPVEQLALYYLKMGDVAVAEQLVRHYLRNDDIAPQDKRRAEQLHRYVMQSAPSLQKSPIKPPAKKP